MAFFTLIYIPFILALIVIPIILVIQVVNNETINNNSKIFWAVLILCGNVVGIVIYFFAKDKNILK